MNIYGCIVNTIIEAFLSSASRYKLVVLAADSSMPVDDSIDLGKELSKVIFGMDRSNDVHFQFAVQDAIGDIIGKNVRNDVDFGRYIILENPGILFEPALNLDVCNLLKSISKNTL